MFIGEGFYSDGGESKFFWIIFTHIVTSKKAVILILTTLRTSNLMWIHPAKDRSQWQTLVNIVINIWFL
jgi:hypothetical protein